MDKLADPLEALALYRNLAAWGETRRRELSDLFGPVLEIHEAYGAIISRIVVALGKVPPKSVQDVVCRDLIADVFDFMQEWTRMLFEGRTHVAYPLARRAFESLCLLHASMQDAETADKWDKGHSIWNGDVRNKISQLPIGEDGEELKGVYRYFSQGSHPNRELVAENVPCIAQWGPGEKHFGRESFARPWRSDGPCYSTSCAGSHCHGKPELLAST